MNNKELAEEILKNIGSETNVSSLTHCVTRLRFKLVDNSKVNKVSIESIDEVLGVVESNGQFQVIIGNKVGEIYKEIVKLSNIEEENKLRDEEVKEKNSIASKALDLISSIFAPVLNILASISILKGLLAIFVYFNYLSVSSGAYQILHAIEDSALYFMPILMAYTASKKFKANEVTSLILGAILVYPEIIKFVGKNSGTDFWGIPIKGIEYGYTFIPIIISVWLLSKLEKFLNKVMNENLKLFLLPLVCLIIIVPVTFTVVGPLATIITKFVGFLYSFVYNLNPVIVGAIIGAFWQLLVIRGIHWFAMPIIINNIMLYGVDTIFALAISGSIAQAGAVLGVLLKTKNKNIRKVAISTIPTGLLGITEPTIYEITLKYKIPFICASISGAVGGAIAGYSRSALMGYVIPGLLTLPVYFGKGFKGLLIAIAVSYILAAVFTFITFKDPIKNENLIKDVENNTIDKENEEEVIVEESSKEIISSPLNGAVKELSQISDEAFSSGALGKGIAIVPSEGKLVSPVNGVASVVFPTGHAVGITSENGAEILIHIGFDTVNLDGKYFKANVAQGDTVKKGDLLVEFDIDKIKGEGFDITTPVVVTNTDTYFKITPLVKDSVEYFQDILRLEK